MVYVIGKALNELDPADKFKVATKIPRVPENCDPEKFIEDSLKNSLKRLQLDVISGALIHIAGKSAYFSIAAAYRK